MKETIKKVLELYADRQINLASEAAREELAEAIYREVGNFLQWWGKKPDIRYEDRNIFPDDPANAAIIAPTMITDEIAFVTDINGVCNDGVTLHTT